MIETATEKHPADQLADLIGTDNARAAIQAGWDAIRHHSDTFAAPDQFRADYIARILTAAFPALARLTEDVTEWAVEVTGTDGRVNVLHADDPFTDRSVADQYAHYTRLGKQVATAVPVCRRTWHGTWTHPVAAEDKP